MKAVAAIHAETQLSDPTYLTEPQVWEKHHTPHTVVISTVTSGVTALLAYRTKSTSSVVAGVYPSARVT